MNRLELYAGKLARTVLRGRESSNALPLPNQALETKAKFINQVMTGSNGLRRADDIGGQELSYAEVKAIASGNPAVLTLAEADAELQRLALLRRSHMDEQFTARRKVRDLPEHIMSLTQRLNALTADAATLGANQGITIGGEDCLPEELHGILGKRLNSLPENSPDTKRIPLGTYRGLRFGLVLHPFSPPDVFLDGQATRIGALSRDHQGPRAVLNALERIANAYDSECNRTEQDRAIAERQLRDYQARLGASFAHSAYLHELTALRDRLKISLAGGNQTECGEPEESPAELAEKIKTTKATHAMELIRSTTASPHLPNSSVSVLQSAEETGKRPLPDRSRNPSPRR